MFTNERRFSVGSIKHVLTDSGGCGSLNPTPVSPDGAAVSHECCFRCGDVLEFKAAERSGCMTARCAKHTGKFQSRNFTVTMSMNFTV